MKNILLIATALIAIQVHATVYENAEDEKISRWSVYDKTPSGAYLDNVYLEDRDHNAIQLIGAGTSNGYILGNWEGRAGAWNNTKEHILKWSMNFDEAFVVYIRVLTKNGPKYIYYTASNKSYGSRYNGRYIHIGLGKISKNGSWQNFTRDLEADLKRYEPNNALLAVNAFLVRGNGLVDDVVLRAETIPPNELSLNTEQRLIADQIISVFENSTTTIKYGYAEHIEHDQHGITAGRAGFTSATGDMLEIIQAYKMMKPNNLLTKYIEELKRLNQIFINNNYELSTEGANVENLDGLISDWKIESNDTLFRKVQDDYVNKHYFNPALKEVQKIGAKYPLTLLHFYDTAIQHGVDGLRNIIKEVGLSQPKYGGEEITWLKKFNLIRLNIMENTEIDGVKIWEDSVYRLHALQKMIEDEQYNLKPFTLIIKDWGNEAFNISSKTLENTWYKPTLSNTWQMQLSGEVNTNYSVDVYDIDLFDTSKNTIDLLHNQGKKVICYFSAGSYEEWRSDAGDFPSEALGNELDGWEGERWLDVRNDKLNSVMKRRMDLAKAKGCDGVDPDNVDGYTNDTGFDLKYKDQLKYAIFLANEAHKRGLSIGLKNNLDQITELVNHYDFAVNEQCNQYRECDMLSPFIKHSKPVFNIEYSSSYRNNSSKRKQLCQKMKSKQISTNILPLLLNDDFRISCKK